MVDKPIQVRVLMLNLMSECQSRVPSTNRDDANFSWRVRGRVLEGRPWSISWHILFSVTR